MLGKSEKENKELGKVRDILVYHRERKNQGTILTYKRKPPFLSQILTFHSKPRLKITDVNLIFFLYFRTFHFNAGFFGFLPN